MPEIDDAHLGIAYRLSRTKPSAPLVVSAVPADSIKPPRLGNAMPWWKHRSVLRLRFIEEPQIIVGDLAVEMSTVAQQLLVMELAFLSASPIRLPRTRASWNALNGGFNVPWTRNPLQFRLDPLLGERARRSPC